MELIIVIYDDRCPLCRALTERLKKLAQTSTAAKFNYVGSSTPEASGFGVPKELYEKQICAVSAGKVYAGPHAISFILSKLPQFPYRLFAYSMRVAYVAILAGLVYNQISKYRYWISRFFIKKK